MSVESQGWAAAQTIDPRAVKPVATLDAGLATGSVGTAGTVSNPPLYTVTGDNGLVASGGATANGIIAANYAVSGAALTVTGNGTSGATNKTAVATSVVSGAGSGSGMTVNLVASGGVVASATIASAGTGTYAIGTVIKVALATAGTGTDVTLVI